MPSLRKTGRRKFRGEKGRLILFEEDRVDTLKEVEQRSIDTSDLRLDPNPDSSYNSNDTRGESEGGITSCSCMSPCYPIAYCSVSVKVDNLYCYNPDVLSTSAGMIFPHQHALLRLHCIQHSFFEASDGTY